MRYTARAVEAELEQKILPNKVLMILGARRVGKSSLINNYLRSLSTDKYLKLNGEDWSDVELLKERTVANYSRLLRNIDLLVIDEAQKIGDIGMILKLIVDEIPNIKVLVTGSSQFDMSYKLGEPLVGRKNVIHLFPFSQFEFSQTENLKDTMELRTHRLIYGSYPELEHLDTEQAKKEYLMQMVNDYLLKDILEFEGIRHSAKIYELLKLIALQIGSEVSYQELAQQLGLSKLTVERYLDLLSKVFVLYKVGGYSRNLRKEVAKSSKWYFFDNGIRNALLRDFNAADLRGDLGALWENYLVYERVKYQYSQRTYTQNYFWRTYDQQEIDWIEEESGSVHAFEFKISAMTKVKPPKGWVSNYPNAPFSVIHPGNYLDWLGC